MVPTTQPLLWLGEGTNGDY